MLLNFKKKLKILLLQVKEMRKNIKKNMKKKVNKLLLSWIKKLKLNGI